MGPEAARDAARAKGLEIFRLMGTDIPAVFDRKWWAGRMMERVMRDPALKVPLFRFVDVLPALSANRQVARHARQYFAAGNSPLPWFVNSLLCAAESGVGPAAALTAFLVRRGVARFSKTFIAGETPRAALAAFQRLVDEGKTFTVDLLGEAVVSEAEADAYRDLYLALAGTLAREMPGQVNVSVKVSALYSRIGAVNREDSVLEVRRRLAPILAAVRGARGAVCLDMEQYALKDITLDAFTQTLDDPAFEGWERAGIALQAYLRCAERDLRRLIGWAKDRNRRVAIRLVKGAYWEYETVVARQKGWEIPVFSRKTHTDWNFERCVEVALENHDHVTLAVGSHNVRSIAFALATAERLGVPRERYEFQMLFGMGDPIKRALKQMGFAVREYAPVGALLPGMAYLVRRLLENASNEGFLQKVFLANVSRDALLAEPEPYVEAPGEGEAGTAEAGTAEAAAGGSAAGGIARFSNEPPADFTVSGTRTAFRNAVAEVGKRAGQTCPAVIGGKEYRTGEPIVSVNPARPRDVVGTVYGITAELADRAVAVAREAQNGWAQRAPEERAAVLFRAARIASGRRAELAAWQVRETGKSWAESDADVAEAIDYLEYYGREMIRLGKPVRMGDCPGEENVYLYRPRGVGLVVAPWNFPLAISVGMASAALVTGNAVLYKPSSLSPVNGWLAFSLLREGGVPDGALNFIPGKGDAVGDRLVGNPGVDFILFTGSRAVGLRIVEKAGQTAPGQRVVKRAVVEMGGKNAILVDADADLDQAVPAVIASAFGYQGQKCSACSRAIVHADCYDRFVARICDAVKGLRVGPPDDPANTIGPLIDGAARDRVQAAIALGRREGRVAADIPVPEDGFYVSPTILTDLPADSKLLKEEIFGPVLAVIRARDMEEAVDLANASDYALTGGLFSRSPATIARVRETFAVGNLYINRGITGALVGRQPFGGFRMSGVGSKAGGPDYLLQFMEPRVITENTMRRGFSPDVVP